MYNYNIAVPEFFNILLKHSGQHYRQLLQDVHDGYLPADTINSILLSKNNKAFAREALPLELLEMKAGYDDDEEYTPDELKKVQDSYIDNQLDSNLADAVKENNTDSDKFNAEQISKDLLNNAKDDHFNVTIDRILNGIQESEEIPEDDKVGAALAFLYNTTLKGQNKDTLAADYKLDMHDLNTLLDTDSVKERVVSDYVPITYKSDKDSFTDSDGNLRYRSLFTPNKESLAMFDLFANKFVDDIKAGKEIPFNTLGKYIKDVYNDTLRTMSYSDWVDRLEDEWIAEQKKQKLGSPADYTDEEWAEKAKSFNIPKASELTAGKELLTPEDWAEDKKYGFQDYVIPKPRKSQAKKGGRWQHTTTDEGDYDLYQNHLLAYINSDKHAKDLLEMKDKLTDILISRLDDCINELEALPDDDKLDELPDDEKKAVITNKKNLQKRMDWYTKMLNPRYDNQDVRLTNLAEQLLRRKIQRLYHIRDRADEFRKTGYDNMSYEEKSNKYGNLNNARKDMEEALLVNKELTPAPSAKKSTNNKEDSNDTEFSIIDDMLDDDEYKTLDNKVLKRTKSDEEQAWEEVEDKYASEDEDEGKQMTVADWAQAHDASSKKRTYTNQKKVFDLLDQVRSDDNLL